MVRNSLTFLDEEETIIEFNAYEPDNSDILNLLGLNYKKLTSHFERLFVWYVFAIRTEEKEEGAGDPRALNLGELELISFYKFYIGKIENSIENFKFFKISIENF